MPHDYGGGVGDVEAVFGATLRNFDAAVAGIYRLLAHTLHLVAENDSVFFARLSVKLLKADAAVHLLNGANLVALATQMLNSLHHCGVVRPVHTVFRTQCRFVDFGRWWGGGNAAQGYVIDNEGIGGAKHTANIHLAAHIIKHHSHRYLIHALKLLGGDTPKVKHTFLLHIGKVSEYLFIFNVNSGV